MEKMIDWNGLASEHFYRQMLDKVNNTINRYKQVAEVAQCGEIFEALELAAFSKDAQVNHLLSIANCLLKYVPDSPALEEVFTNFLKDYIHLVNPAMPPYIGDYYLTDEFIRAYEQQKLNRPGAQYRYI